ncbi:restriction endonuclease subunit S [Morganella morganii]
MSELSYLEKLLDGVEVAWVPLEDIAKIYDGTHQTPKYTSSGVPFVSVQNIKNLYDTDKFISSEDFEKYKNKPRKHDLFMTRIGDVGTCAIVEDDKPLAYYVTLALIRVNQQIAVPGFIRHLIESGIGKAELYKRTLIHAVPMKINLGEIGKIVIPIPCPDNSEKSLAIQSEIVRILDTFSTLTAELTAELTVRKKQYNYYRDQLLSFNDGEVEWKPLGEIGEVRMCKRILKSQTTSEGDIPFYKIGTFGKKPDAYISRSLFNEFKEKYTYPKSGEILISASGTIGRTVIFDGKESYFQDSNIVWIENDEKIILNKYLFYFYQIAKWEISEGGTIQRLYNENLRKLEIPVPFPRNPEKSLAEQARIVRILDKFDTLSTSITEGLPREIELRQKQYEYYRDLLFSFPKPESVNN